MLDTMELSRVDYLSRKAVRGEEAESVDAFVGSIIATMQKPIAHRAFEELHEATA